MSLTLGRHLQVQRSNPQSFNFDSSSAAGAHVEFASSGLVVISCRQRGGEENGQKPNSEPPMLLGGKLGFRALRCLFAFIPRACGVGFRVWVSGLRGVWETCCRAGASVRSPDGHAGGWSKIPCNIPCRGGLSRTFLIAFVHNLLRSRFQSQFFRCSFGTLFLTKFSDTKKGRTYVSY